MTTMAAEYATQRAGYGCVAVVADTTCDAGDLNSRDTYCYLLLFRILLPNTVSDGASSSLLGFWCLRYCCCFMLCRWRWHGIYVFYVDGGARVAVALPLLAAMVPTPLYHKDGSKVEIIFESCCAEGNNGSFLI